VSVADLTRGRPDVPEDFLRRLADLDLSLKNASNARFPGLGQKDADGRFTRIRDKATGESGSVYWIKITTWLSDADAEVEAGRNATGGHSTDTATSPS
jgi:hypothetical protein